MPYDELGSPADDAHVGDPDDKALAYSYLKQIVNNSNHLDGHEHTRERWFGIRIPQTATLWAEVESLAEYQVTSGNGVFGNAIQVLGTGDTPQIAGRLGYDCHRIVFADLSSALPYIIRFIFGPTDVATEEAAGNYTDCLVKADQTIGPPGGGAACDIRMPVLRTGIDKIWAKCKNPNTETMDFYVGTHEYSLSD